MVPLVYLCDTSPRWSVLPSSFVNEISTDEISPNDLSNGYTQSKWVAEKLMTKASRSGLPVVIYRLGSICGNTKTGVCNRYDLHTLLLAAILKTGYYPTVATNSVFNGLSDDFTAKSIIYLSRKQTTVVSTYVFIISPMRVMEYHSQT